MLGPLVRSFGAASTWSTQERNAEHNSNDYDDDIILCGFLICTEKEKRKELTINIRMNDITNCKRRGESSHKEIKILINFKLCLMKCQYYYKHTQVFIAM